MKQNIPLCPARLQPIFVPRIWGSPSLAPLFADRKSPDASSPTNKMPIGEVWLTESKCAFANGPYAGRTLGDAWRTMPPEWKGTSKSAMMSATTPFPVLAKFLFPSDKLSVQVHPPDEYAQKHEAAAGGVGKTEMWYAVEAKPGAEVFVGLKPGVTRQVFRRAIDEGTAENCLTRLPISAGDTIFVPAGTAHTIGPGLILCEIQQTSDITYRVFDYGRRQPDGSMRALQINKAMDVLNFDHQRGGKQIPTHIVCKSGDVTPLAACRYFTVEKWQSSGPLSLQVEPEHFEVLIVISGSGQITWSTAPGNNPTHAEYSAGEAWLLPAALGAWRVEPIAASGKITTLLRVYVPALDQYAARLAAAGISADAAARIIQR